MKLFSVILSVSEPTRSLKHEIEEFHRQSGWYDKARLVGRNARMRGDRPPVIPYGSTNVAFLGEFAELPVDAAFTTEYAVRTARVAVSELLGLERKPPPPYQGLHDPAALCKATKVLA